MKFKILLALLLSNHLLFSQQLIEMDNHKGVFFSSEVELDFTIDSLRERFTPTREDVVLADNLVLKNKMKFIKIWGKSFKKEVKKSVRQFVGYIDLSGDKHIVVILLNMHRHDSEKYFSEWRSKPIVGFGEFYERNLKTLDVNISKKNVKLH